MSPQGTILFVSHCSKMGVRETTVQYIEPSGIRRPVCQRISSSNQTWLPGIMPAIQGAMDEGIKKAIIDLNGVPAINSDIFDQLLSLFWWIKTRGGGVVFARPFPAVAKDFEYSKLDKVLKVFQTVEEAVEFLCQNEEGCGT